MKQAAFRTLGAAALLGVLASSSPAQAAGPSSDESFFRSVRQTFQRAFSRRPNPSVPKVSGKAVQQAGEDFSYFVPMSVRLLRDGGTMYVEGNVNRSIEGSIHYDGKMGSRTQGVFFVTLKEWNGPPGVKRVMTKSELAGLKNAITRYVNQNPTDQDAMLYRILLQNIDKALKR